MSSPHPVHIAMGELAHVRMVEHTRCADPAWHFRLAVPWPARMAPVDPEVVPAPDAPKTLLWLRYDQPEADLEVSGHRLERELDPADWLAISLEAEGKKVVSSKPMPAFAGTAGDVVASWSLDGREVVARYYALKWGSRLFVLSLTAHADDYAKLAERFMPSIASFSALEDAEGPFAEKVKMMGGKNGFRWEAALPDSWWPQKSRGEPPVVGFDATAVRDGDLSQVDGKLSVGLLPRHDGYRPRELAALYLDVLALHRIEVDMRDFVEESVGISGGGESSPFEASWSAHGRCRDGELEGEVRCRVMVHPRAWVVAGLVGPTREQSPLAWASNKRALDVVTSTLVIGGEEAR